MGDHSDTKTDGVSGTVTFREQMRGSWQLQSDISTWG